MNTLEINQQSWIEKVSNETVYLLNGFKIDTTISKIHESLGAPTKIVTDTFKTYEVHYYKSDSFSVVGYQVKNSVVTGFTLVNKSPIEKEFIFRFLPPFNDKTVIIGEVHATMDYTIEGFIYSFDKNRIKIKTDVDENNIFTFYIGDEWKKIDLESFPSEID
ncbi:hypothetical protein [Tenacibaculum sp. M341]|uniref:hypothetical protein n=1 Tax=Tenacibaculum sp. M341 TaxID=2530339 RepID=UPI001047A76B|nr:hypothetical protein [Tenacibaculum sp. M341]TCI90590.1 hypothetical protein EYW44_12750 [Tenacibaculum sp. M341]